MGGGGGILLSFEVERAVPEVDLIELTSIIVRKGPEGA